MNKFPLYLKALYESDAEVVDEAAIKAWHTAASGELSTDVDKSVYVCLLFRITHYRTHHRLSV